MNKSDISQLIGNPENSEIEYKSAKGGLPESFWQTFSAFANTNGGIIVLGMREKDGKLIPDGLDEDQITKYKKAFWDCAHNKAKVSATMLAENDVAELEVEGQRLLVFHVPRASYDLRPVYLTSNPFGNTYKRNHEGDYRCTDNEVRLMFADAHSTNQSYDSQILPSYTLEDIDIDTLRSYRQRFLLRKQSHPWNEESDLGFLRKIGAYRVDRETGNEGFTRAGILMFGKTSSITDQACCPWYFVDYQERLDMVSGQRWSDRIYPDGAWEANLFQFFYRVYNKLAQSLPVPFMLDGILRSEETTAHIALREALVNMEVHCNYAEQGNMVVIRDPHRIILRNPGRMLISVEDFYAGSYSRCRNPLIQGMFMQLGYGERAGSGADVIVKGWTDNGWKKPIIEERVQPDETSLTLVVDTSAKSNQEPKDSMPDSNGLSQVVPSLSQDVPSLSQVLSQVCPKLSSKYHKEAGNLLKSIAANASPITDLMEVVGEKNRTRFRNNILNILIESGLVSPTLIDRPNSPKQKYILTEKGKVVLGMNA